jgi:hypothetical membrane protein
VHITLRLSLQAGVAVPLLYFCAQAFAAPFFPNFSVLTHTASQLGSDLSSQPAILNGGAALTGATALAASYGLYRGLRSQGVWLAVAVLVAASSTSMGLASLWAAIHPMPDPRHNPGALGAGVFAAPILALIASLALSHAVQLKRYLVANVVGFFVVASLYSGLISIDLRLYGGAVQRLGALVMFVPFAILCLWLLRNARPDDSAARTRTE